MNVNRNETFDVRMYVKRSDTCDVTLRVLLGLEQGCLLNNNKAWKGLYDFMGFSK